MARNDGSRPFNSPPPPPSPPFLHAHRRAAVPLRQEAVAAGREIRIDYEDGGASNSYWIAGRPPETDWRARAHVHPPPPTAAEPILRRHTRAHLELEADDGTRPAAPLPWQGPRGGDERLRLLVPSLIPSQHRGQPGRLWALVATHLPGRSGEECFERWGRVLSACA